MRVFDFDNTIYDGESVIDFYLFSLRRNPKVARYVPVVLYHLLRYKLGRTTMADLEQAGRKYAAQYLSSFDDPEGLVRDFWDGHIRKIKAWYHPEKDDVIVLMGKGHETYQILKNGTIHLDEREVVAEALKSIK